MMTCAVCDKLIGRGRPNKKYCSDLCRSRGQKTRPIRVPAEMVPSITRQIARRKRVHGKESVAKSDPGNMYRQAALSLKERMT